MTLQQLQSQIDSWIKIYGKKYFSELTNLGILMEETGELSRHIVRKYGEQSYREKITDQESFEVMADEMADVLWVLCCLANQTGVDLTKAMEKNLQKKTDRDSLRHIQNTKLD